MNHIAEHIIEAHVRHPEALDAVTAQSVATHLKGCRACRAIADYLRTFYAELDGVEDSVSPQVEKWIAAHFAGSRIIPLYPFRPEPDKLYASDEYTVVLAAMTHESPAPRFQTVATLASVEKSTLLRILRDNATGTFRVYILAEDRRQREHAIISFPELGMNLMADEKGQAVFALAEQALATDGETLTSVLKLPVLEVNWRSEMLRQKAMTLQETTSDYTAKIAYAQDPAKRGIFDTLTLDIQPRRREAATSTLAVVEGSAGQKFLVPLHDGKGDFRLAPLPETLVIRFYC
jgi:hypothetical protein